MYRIYNDDSPQATATPISHNNLFSASSTYCFESVLNCWYFPGYHIILHLILLSNFLPTHY